MSSTSPEATPVASSDDSSTRHLEGMSGDAESFEAESPQARQAKAEALAHARAARAKRAEYARLVSQQAGVPNPNPGNKMQAESISDMVAAQGNSIVGAEMSLISARLLDQAHTLLEENVELAKKPVLSGIATGATTWIPIALLRPATRRHGLGGFVTHPRMLTLAPVAVLAVTKGILDARRAEKQKKLLEEQTKLTGGLGKGPEKTKKEPELT